MSKKNRVLAMLILAVFLFLSLLIFIKTTQKNIKIGVILPTKTQLGYEEDLAFRFIRKKLQDENETRISFDIVNPALDSVAIVNEYRKMESDGIDIIIGGEISKTGVILAEEAARSGITTFGVTTSTHLLNGRKDNFYRILPSTDQVGRRLGEYVSGMGNKRVTVVLAASNKAYSEALDESFKSGYTDESISLFYSDDSIFMDEISAFEPDAFVLILPGVELGRCIKRVRNKYPEITIYSSDWGFEQLVSLFSREDLENVYTFTDNEEADSSYQPIIDEFEKSYEINSTFAGIYALSISKILQVACRMSGYDAQKVKEYLNTPRMYKTGFGRVFMDEYGDATNEFFYIRSIKDGKIVTDKKIKLKNVRDNE